MFEIENAGIAFIFCNNNYPMFSKKSHSRANTETTSTGSANPSETGTTISQSGTEHPSNENQNFRSLTPKARRSDTQHMMALQWFGKKDVRIEKTGRVMLTDPGDVIVNITTAGIGGSDLHVFRNLFPKKFLQKEDIIGHEAVGIVSEVGPDVRNLSPGDRVVISSIICCGSCHFCKKNKFSLCENTNQSEESKKSFGYPTAGIFGMSKLQGGFDGLTAEYARIPYADHNVMRIPQGISDTTAILLSDVLCTAWHGMELGDVKSGDNVLIMGAGPVGAATAQFATKKGANVILVDHIPFRLELATKNIQNIRTVNFEKEDLFDSVRNIWKFGPDVCIDCVGLGCHKKFSSKVKRAFGLESEGSNVIDDMITMIKKGGRIAIVGDYIGYTDHINFGAIFSKSLQIRAGLANVQAYWKNLLNTLEKSEYDFNWLISQSFPLEQAPKAYKLFDSGTDVMKLAIKVNPQETVRT